MEKEKQLSREREQSEEAKRKVNLEVIKTLKDNEAMFRTVQSIVKKTHMSPKEKKKHLKEVRLVA